MSTAPVSLPVIPGYDVIRVLGEGGMASVYLAVQESFGRAVALKVMSPILLAQRDFAERFRSEARMVASLSHPGIITVYDVGVHEQYHYIAMEYHAGGHLGQRIAQGVSAQEALTIARDLALALDHAHENGIIHRNMKPDNVLFSKRSTPVITDFGIARNTYGDSQLTQIGSTVGTPKYMSPEQARGEKVDARADLYSLGVILYEMLTGQPPFNAQDTVTLAIKHCQEPIPNLPLMSEQYQPLLDRMLAKLPVHRYQTGREVAAAIDHILSPPASHPVPVRVTTPSAAGMTTGQHHAGPVGESTRPQAHPAQPSLGNMQAKATYYQSQDTESGGFFNRRIRREVRFMANDFDEFSRYFERLAAEVATWQQAKGRKADTLHLAIEAHPWIHKRIIDKLNAAHPPGHGYGDFARSGSVTLHLFDELEPEGKQLQLRDRGRPAG